MSTDPSTARRGIICVGTIIIDCIKVVDRYPPVEELALIESESEDSGGPAFNMAVDLARLGAPFPVELAGLIGDDLRGARVLEICRQGGIGTRGLGIRPDAPTSYTDVMVEARTGRRTFFQMQGANGLLTPDQLDLTSTSARFLHLGAPGLHAALDRTGPGGNGFTEILGRARAAGLQTNMELVSISGPQQRTITGPCLPLLDTLIVNELEAGALSEIDPYSAGKPDLERIERAARGVLARGVRRLCVVHFPQGCVAASADGRTWRQPSVRVPPQAIQSTNGAGDAFAAGVLLGLHEGWPVERCLRLAVCSAAASLESYSTSGSIRPADECLARGERAGFLPM
jgi:sugar/nucleoside kinase (ribokinase family)